VAGYQGMMPEMDSDTLVIDDISHFETERLLEIYKPDIFCAGVKEKYAVQKMPAFPASSCTATTTAGRTPDFAARSTSITTSIAW
jgi:nitrogenase molybdenum-iron protein alpha/beta subunit